MWEQVESKSNFSWVQTIHRTTLFVYMGQSGLDKGRPCTCITESHLPRTIRSVVEERFCGSFCRLRTRKSRFPIYALSTFVMRPQKQLAGTIAYTFVTQTRKEMRQP